MYKKFKSAFRISQKSAAVYTWIGAFNYSFISQLPVLRTTKTNPAIDVFYIKNIRLKRQIYIYIHFIML